MSSKPSKKRKPQRLNQAVNRKAVKRANKKGTSMRESANAG